MEGPHTPIPTHPWPPFHQCPSPSCTFITVQEPPLPHHDALKPAVSTRVNLGMACAMGLDQGLMTHSHDYSVPAPSYLSFAYPPPCLLSSFAFSRTSCSRRHTHVTFPVWYPSLSNVHLRLLPVFLWFHSLMLFNGE